MVSDTGKFRELLNEHRLVLRKSLGQNFLVDPNIPGKIVKLAGVAENHGVLEIGPGIGALTYELCKVAKCVIAIELDSRLFPVLNDVLSHYDNISLIKGDVLKLDINGIVAEGFGDMPKVVCANLPYGITTPILATLFESSAFSEITVMIQREVARRICAMPGTPEYGAFSVFVNYHSVPKILFDVPPECFMPKPKVHSSVIKMAVREKRLLEPNSEKHFFRVVRSAFEQRRKTLTNALNSTFNAELNKPAIENAIKKCGFSSQVRGEMLSLEEFISLANELKKVTI